MLNFLKKLFPRQRLEHPTAAESLRAALAGQQRAETGLRRSEEHFDQLVAGVEDYAIFLLDREGNVASWNTGAERIKGYREEEIIGQHFSRFYLKDAVKAGWPAHELNVAATTGRFKGEGWRVRKDGSHFRNPLAPIRNALHIMNMPGANGEAIERARQMTERQVQHMVRLVDDLLDVARIMRGRVELHKEPVELTTVVARALETAQPVLDAQGQELDVSVPPEPLHLHADPIRLTQVIGNLLNNAAKFSTRPGRVWLTAERDISEAVLRVRDEGIGIAPDLLPHVFDLFVQGNKSLERSQGGLGIGLTVVRKLVEMHGGNITAQSEGPGKGSEFIVRLPLLQQAAKHEGTDVLGQPPLESPSRRVLVVDDNVDVAESIAVLLKLWGHQVRVAYTGPEALQAAEEYQPEVMVLDIGLPGMNGYEVAQRLRQQPRFQGTVLAAITGYGREDDRRRSEDAGFDHHLTKPVDPEALQRLLALPKALPG